MRHASCARAIAAALGAVLVTAGLLKLFGTNASAAAQLDGPFRAEFRALLIPVELLLGLWLISGYAKRAAWMAALVMFALFVIVSGSAGWRGSSSCGCLGAAVVNPWYVFAFDFLAVGALLLTRPRGPFAPADWAAIKLGGITVGILGIVIAAAIGLFGSWAVAVGYVFGHPLVAIPADIDLGRFEPNHPVEAQVEFVSLSATPIQVVTGQSDCRCVTPRGLPIWVQPGERVRVVVRVDPPGGPGAFSRRVVWVTSAGRISGHVIGTVNPGMVPTEPQSSN